jgi:RNA polymerase sigma-70 factor, ECF subfamily
VAESNQTRLRAAFAEDYDGLYRRLTKRLGSSELASEALHETFLRVDRASSVAQVQRPRDYLFRIAINIATDRRREERRLLNADEIDSLLHVADESPDPAQILEAREEVRALEKALAELPDRQRAIFFAAVIRSMPDHAIAERLGLTVRTVERDLQRALQHCARRLGRSLLRRGGGPRGGPQVRES